MLEVITEPQVTEPVVTEPEVVTPEPVLPSDAPAADAFDGFNLTDELKGKFKDGKLNGRFESVQDILDKLKETEDKFANDVRTNGNQQQEQVQKQEESVVKSEAMNTLTPALLDGGMVVTPEIEAAVKEAGLDIRDVQLNAMRLEKAKETAFGLVGGEENYRSMQEWASTALSDADKRVFEADIGKSEAASSIAIQWLNDKYQKAINDGTTTRISGNPANVGLKPYVDRKVLFRDKDVAEQARRRGDNTLWNAYQKKLSITAPSVYGM